MKLKEKNRITLEKILSRADVKNCDELWKYINMLQKFCYGRHDEIYNRGDQIDFKEDGILYQMCLDHAEVKEFLIEKGFIEEIEEERMYYSGQLFENEKQEIYVLVISEDDQKAHLTRYKSVSGHSGWRSVVCVNGGIKHSDLPISNRFDLKDFHPIKMTKYERI